MFSVVRHTGIESLRRQGAAGIALFFAALPVGAAPLDPPTPEQLGEARQIVQAMIADPRGPYRQIRWFCNDGSVQPPVAYACRERGGGRQHAQYSAARQRMAELGWSVGTIFAALPFDELFDADRRNQRLRQLPLERYLVDIDDGWVLRRARDYRGRVQLEDEAAAGRERLLQLLSRPDWVGDNYLLFREAVRTIPHGEDSGLARSVRRKATQLSELDSAAERWRAEIHSVPDAGTAERLRRWADAREAGPVRALAEALAADLDALYGAQGRRDRIDTALRSIGNSDAANRFRREILAALAQTGPGRIAGLCSTLAGARATHFASLAPERQLVAFDAMQELDTEVQLAYLDIADSSRSRASNLALSHSLLHCAYSAGFLSATELASVTAPVENLTALPISAYRDIVARLKRTPGWAIGAVRHTFAEALLYYGALDTRATRFSDDLLRGSAMWILGDVLKVLSRDLDTLSGSVVEIGGKPVAGAVALNSGVARGRLRIFETNEALELAVLTRSDIVAVPETIAELSPVGGILTLGEGNPLSHVQLLARNFGIPNVAVDYDAIERLRELEDEPVLMIVSAGGDVLVSRDDGTAIPAAVPPTDVVIPEPDLTFREILALDDIGKEMSGRVVGPKAANLGELNRLFPGRVAPAVAIPFGIYAAHLDDAGLTSRIQTAFAGHKNGLVAEPEFNAELAKVRADIQRLSLSEDVREELAAAMRSALGDPGDYGVFVRSDTNVEDLPQFTGAGLNETIPHLVDTDAQYRAVPRVWSSVLSPRALAWRSSVLANPERIYASVLLMKSVPATKSGVLVTKNLFRSDVPGLTVSTAWGVGGAVAGEAAESLVIRGDAVEILSEAKSPYRRQLAADGGVDWRPAPAGVVLEAAEIEQLRQLASEVRHRYDTVFDDAGNARPWDIEFGFVDGELTLFQIRPLVERSAGAADALLQRLRPGRADDINDGLLVRLDVLPDHDRD